MKESEFTEVVFPRVPPTAMRAATDGELARDRVQRLAVAVRAYARDGSDGLRFAHGSCRKYPKDTDPNQRHPGRTCSTCSATAGSGSGRGPSGRAFSSIPATRSMPTTSAFACATRCSRSARRRRCRGRRRRARSTSPTVPGQAGSAGAMRRSRRPAAQAPTTRRWSRCGRVPVAVREDQLEGALALAKRHAAAGVVPQPRPRAKDLQRRQRHRYRILNGLLWQLPDEASDVPRVDIARARACARTCSLGRRCPREAQLRPRYPAAGDNLAYTPPTTPSTPRATSRPRHAGDAPAARAPAVVHDLRRPRGDRRLERRQGGWRSCTRRRPPAPLADDDDRRARVRVYQGWGNLAPSARRATRASRCSKARGARARRVADAAPPRTRTRGRADGANSAAARRGDKLDWHSRCRCGAAVPRVDLRTDREVNGAGGMSAARRRGSSSRWPPRAARSRCWCCRCRS